LGRQQEELLSLEYGLGALGYAEFQSEQGVVRKLGCDLGDKLNGKAVLDATSSKVSSESVAL
jgi:hypothetical protein